MPEPARDARARPPRAPLALPLLAAGFLLARLGYYLLGVRFNASTLDTYWQFVDPFLLRREPLVSILYLHSQPPLFNLLLALALQPGRAVAPLVLQALLLACSVGLAACVYSLQRRLEVPPRLAAASSFAFAASPAFVLHENWLFYSLPTAALLAAVCLAFHAAVDGRRHGLHLCLWGAALLCLLRAAFHPLWFVLLALALALTSGERRGVARAALGPALLLAVFVIKNSLLFGTPMLSSWVGQSLSRLTVERLAPAERDALVREGRLSEAARVPSFSPPESYPASLMAIDEESLPRVLTQQRKAAGAVNYHAIGYLRVSRALLADSLWVVAHRPAIYFSGVLEAWTIYFRSPCAVPFFGVDNRRATAALCEAQDRWLLWRRAPDAGGRAEDGICLAILILSPGLVALAAAGALGRGPLAGRSRGQRALLGLLAANVTYVALAGNALELGENNRFRFETDGLSVVLLGLALAAPASRLASSRAPSRPD